MTGLRFCPATSGGYGIVRIGADIPESQILMASSSACGRHISVSSFDAGYRDRISFYVADEKEIILGTMEDGLAEAAGRIISERRPKILLIYVCCSTYIAGLDNDRLRSRIKRENPGTEVQVMDMNPVAAGTSNPPSVATQRKIVGLFKITGRKDRAINLIGSDAAPMKGCELYDIAECNGIEIRHLTLCKTYDEFTEMGSSSLNAVLSSKAMVAAKEISDRIPYLSMLPTYSIDRVRENYGKLFDMMGMSYDLGHVEEKTARKVESTAEFVRGMSISVGSTATERPFGLAKALYDYGMDVRSVFHDGISKAEAKDVDYLRSETPSLKIYDCGDPSMSSKIGKCDRADIAIGFNASYFTRAEHNVDIVLDTGLFGFHGIEAMMEAIIESVRHPKGLTGLVEKANLVI